MGCGALAAGRRSAGLVIAGKAGRGGWTGASPGGTATFRWTPHAPQRTVVLPSARRAAGTLTSRRDRQRWQSTCTVFEPSSRARSTSPRATASTSVGASHRARRASAAAASLMFDPEVAWKFGPMRARVGIDIGASVASGRRADGLCGSRRTE